MKLHILSDLHLSVQGMSQPTTSADVVVLAGDISRPERAAPWALGFGKPVLYVIGNHEFYGSSLPEVKAAFHRLFDGTHVHLLDDSALVLGGVRFLGSTMWTDFKANGAGDKMAEAMRKSSEFMFDFQRVRSAAAADAPLLTPEDTTRLFATSTRWLDAELAKPFAGPTVVITHHAPTLHSIHPRFAGSPFNAAFVSDAAWLLRGGRAQLWIHGHTHDSYDYLIDRTRVLCNPRGYVKDGQTENPHFDPELVVQVG